MALDPPVNKAVALGYTFGMPSPRVLAQGQGLLAQAIVDKAKELGIPARTEPALVEFLMTLDVNAWVPPELYAAVAEVLAWAYEESQRELPLGAQPVSTEPVRPADS